MNNFIISLLITISGAAQAETYSEKVKVTGFFCDMKRAAIKLRSFEQDHVLYLAENETGLPKHFNLLQNHCEGLTKNLGNRLTGKIIDLNFHTESFAKTETFFVEPNNPCQPGRTKCDEGYFEEKLIEFERTETMIDTFRFFKEQMK